MIKFIYGLLIFVCATGNAQSNSGFSRNHHLLHSTNWVTDKNFYLFTVLNKSSALSSLLEKNSALNSLYKEKQHYITDQLDSCKAVECFFSGLEWLRSDSVRADEAIKDLYTHNQPMFDKVINGQLRPSGCYEKFASLNNRDYFLKAWGQCETGLNYIIDQYGLGKKLRYPQIDSVSYDVKGNYYKGLTRSMLAELKEEKLSNLLFYQPSLNAALLLMDMNNRDEAARLEPLETGENKKAFQQLKHMLWSNYKYATILILGSGPDVVSLPLSPIGKLRCRLGALRYRQGLSPFIIVSGGFVHPFHTPNCEALEMKKYLVKELSIPESAIFIEPQARHTTTNIRNANRLIYRYGIPVNKPSLIVSSESHIDWIMNLPPNQNFDKRCMQELGYLPYRDKQRMSKYDISYYPVKLSLHFDPMDPLDP